MNEPNLNVMENAILMAWDYLDRSGEPASPK